jgi:perosamine synthetase
MEIPSAKPFFSEEDIQSISQEVSDVLRSGRLILGPYTKKFEQAFRDYCGVSYAVAVSSCTAALEISLRYFNIRGKEVIVPTNTFIATSNAVLYAGGTLVLADIRPETLCLDPADLRRRITPRTGGVIVVHIAGLPCPDIDEIRNICREHGLFLLEDAAHAHGATIGGRKTGSIGDAGCFSFYPTKVMTACTGGMITTNSSALAEYAVSLRHHGVGNGLNHIINLGNDWLMSEIGAVLGHHQLDELESNLAKRNTIAARYIEALAGNSLAVGFSPPSGIRHSYYKYPVFLSPGVEKKILVRRLKDEYGIDIGSVYDPPVHLHPVYQRLFAYPDGSFPNADKTLTHTCCLPMYVRMTPSETDYVITSFLHILPECERAEVAAREGR